MKCLPTALIVTAILAHVPCTRAKQVFTARYYPERHNYLVGEPIIVDLEVVNHSDTIGEISESDCAWTPGPFEVEGAPPKKEYVPFSCGPKAIAGSCLIGASEIPAQGKYLKRLLLDGPFVLDSPGTYHVRATSEQDISRPGSSEVLARLHIDSEFELTLRAPQAAELEAAYKPFLADLKSRDPSIRYFAASAIAENPPHFAEATILALTHRQMTAIVAIEALGRLATPTARARLIQMAATGPEEFRQPAIQALGELNNPMDCRAMLGIARRNQDFTQGEAYIYVARLCKERAVPVSSQLLSGATPSLSGYLAVSFENTSSRNAVPPLISLLVNPDQGVRREAEEALQTLTHRKARFGVASAESSDKSRIEWTNWWAANGGTAIIYGPDQCAEPLPLP